MKDWQNGPIADGVQKFADMPRRGQWACFRFSISDHSGDNQLGIIERRAACMRKHVTELAAFMDGARGLRSTVAPDPAGERELLKEFPYPAQVFALVGIDLG